MEKQKNVCEKYGITRDELKKAVEMNRDKRKTAPREPTERQGQIKFSYPRSGSTSGE